MRSGTGVGPGICKKWRPAILGVLVGIWAQMLGLLGPFLSHVLGLYTRPEGIHKRAMTIVASPGLERRLKAEGAGEILFDAFTRGRYATDASSYQMMPLGVVVPRTIAEAEKAIAVARSEGVTVLLRGGGSSQCGQTVNHSLVIDCSKHLNKIISLDAGGRTCVVQPGIVL